MDVGGAGSGNAPVVLRAEDEVGEQDGDRSGGERYNSGGQREEAERVVRARRK